jgi:hypothetical protein
VPTVGIFIDFDSKPASASVAAMKQEVDNLFKSAGVSLDWRSLGDNRGDRAFKNLVVVRFHGKCKVEYTPVPENDFGTLGETVRLGYTPVEDGHPLPYSEIECDKILKTLPFMQEGATQSEKQSIFGRALGYVVAHELYHILARTTHHAGSGLAKAKETWRDLVSGNLHFGARDSEAIREGVLYGSGAPRTPGAFAFRK